MDFKYKYDDKLIGLKVLTITDDFKINFKNVQVKVINTNPISDIYALKVITYSKDNNDFIFNLKRELLDDEENFVPLDQYKKYKTYGDTIMLRTSNNNLREYTIEEIDSNGSLYENYITLKLKSCD